MRDVVDVKRIVLILKGFFDVVSQVSWMRKTISMTPGYWDFDAWRMCTRPELSVSLFLYAVYEFQAAV